MKRRAWGKGGVAFDEFLPLIIFLILAALVFFIFKVDSKASYERSATEVNRQKEEVVALNNIRQFAQKYHKNIVESHKIDNYDGLGGISKDFFRERYTARSFGWRLEIVDANGETKKMIAEDRGYASVYHASISVPMPRKVEHDFLTLKLSAGTAFTGKFLEVGPKG